jgi:ABC-type Mn2+/Zn2+ transport system ATPase subunit
MLGKRVEGPAHFDKVGYVPQNGGSNASRFPATAMELVMSSLYRRSVFLSSPAKNTATRTSGA